MVGETGFEPATSWSQTRRATRLRYSPRLVPLARFQFVARNVRVHVVLLAYRRLEILRLPGSLALPVKTLTRLERDSVLY
jgi:hypothetical protein